MIDIPNDLFHHFESDTDNNNEINESTEYYNNDNNQDNDKMNEEKNDGDDCWEQNLQIYQNSRRRSVRNIIKHGKF